MTIRVNWVSDGKRNFRFQFIFNETIEQWICYLYQKKMLHPDSELPSSLTNGWFFGHKVKLSLRIPLITHVSCDFIHILFKVCKVWYKFWVKLQMLKVYIFIFFAKQPVQLSIMSFPVKIFNFLRTVSFKRFPSNSN